MKEHKIGMDFAWDAIKRLCKLNDKEKIEIFTNPEIEVIIGLYTPLQVSFMIAQYEIEKQQREEINVGDIVTIDDGDLKFVCTKDNCSGDYKTCHLLSFDGSVWEECKKSSCKKTGKTIDVSSLLEQIK